MPQFKVSDRQTVLDSVREKEFVHSAAPLGNGIVAYHCRGTEAIFTNLTENHGWYVASFDPRTKRDRIVFMPIDGRVGSDYGDDK